MIYVKDYIVDWLNRLGVQVIFGIPGSYVLPLIDSATRKSIPFILTQHEYGAALMADGYSKANGGIPCVITTTGIAATNALSGIYNSYSDGQPVIFITGQVPTTLFGKGALQESVGIGRTIHIEKMFEEVTTYSKMISNAENIKSELIKAEKALLEGRKGPIHISIPIDILQSQIPISSNELPINYTPEKPKANPDIYSKLEKILSNSKMPLLLVGAGCRDDISEKCIKKLADKGIPVATTLRGKGIIDELHPLSLGCIGLYGESKANYFLEKFADLVIVVGVSMSEFTTQCWSPIFKNINIVQVDIDFNQLEKNYRTALSIHSYADDFFISLTNMFSNNIQPSISLVENITLSQKKFEDDISLIKSLEKDRLHPIEAVYNLNRKMPSNNTIWVTDAVVWTENILKVSGAYRHIEAVNQASIGYAPAASIGVKVANPSQYVVSIFGDGGFRQTAMELATAVSHNQAVLWVILNNEKYGSIHAAQKGYYGGNIVGTTYSPIDYVEFGSSLGVESILIKNVESLCEAIDSFLENERPLLLDVRIDDSLPETKARQLVRYKHWNLKKPNELSNSEVDIKTLKGLIKNRY